MLTSFLSALLISNTIIFAIMLRSEPWLLLFALLLISQRLVGGHPESVEAEIDRIYAFADDTVKQRLAQLDQSIVEHRHDPAVRRAIRMYVERWRRGSARLLGRSIAYFPYFSEQLAARGMPDALKYLTIPESALRPFALSHVGAAGFWQLMPGTARELGLTVNDTLDERLDLDLGTQAGLDYLQLQYERYGDWALAMAAYNGGPGRVNRAKRRSGSENFWRLRKYLPRETRAYVPKYIAAAYLFTYFSAHELEAEELDPDLQLTEMITIHDFLSLHRVAQVTQLSPAKVIELNPAYLRGYISPSRRGRTLRLPTRVMPAMQIYLKKLHDGSESRQLPWRSPRLHRNTVDASASYREVITSPTTIDTSAAQLAAWAGVPEHQLLIWSGYGPLDSLESSQAWRYLKVSSFLRFDEEQPERLAAVSPLPPPTQLLVYPKVPPRPRIRPLSLATKNDATKESTKKRPFADIWRWLKGG
ncbi:hypothetical protein CEQ90_11185 [Lewinellaceae bacterium SD302]|nr:hypothetical protein CEQ90_11185 [Lewinellaceae bacterium SD302]